jgi:MoaA/NifB/PqqE/SkfB family radical SAM enzyme
LREWYGGDHSFFKQTYIPTEFYKTQIPDEVYINLETINFCGTVGDPCTAPNFIDVVKVVKSKNPNIRLSISTNGGMRGPAWWTRLALALDKSDVVTFGIDGLEDTNHIYRVGVKWNKLMDNVSAFINAGGTADWQMIMFKHNEHQHDQVKALSEQLKFRSFFKAYNHRFMIESATGRTAIGGDGMPLQPPSSEQHQSIIIKRKSVIEKEKEEWYNAAEKGCVKCQSQTNKDAYIDVETHLLPCCFIAGAKHTLSPIENPNDGYYDLWQEHGGDKVKLSLNNWNDIITGDFFNEIQARWDKKFREGRLIVCSMVCIPQPEIAMTVYNIKNNV